MIQDVTATLKKTIENSLPPKLRDNLYLKAFGLLKVPMIFFMGPSVVEISNERCVVKVPLSRRTKNHLNSMYFGALAAGADCAGGLIAMRLIQSEGNQVSLIFKNFQAEFLKRAEDDVLFTCEDGIEIQKLVHEAITSGERVEMPVHVVATVPSKFGDEPVARFVLTLSLKKKSKV